MKYTYISSGNNNKVRLAVDQKTPELSDKQRIAKAKKAIREGKDKQYAIFR